MRDHEARSRVGELETKVRALRVEVYGPYYAFPGAVREQRLRPRVEALEERFNALLDALEKVVVEEPARIIVRDRHA